MAITVKINGVDRTASLAIETLAISWSANMQSEASMSFYDASPATFRPTVGQSVEVFDAAVRIYYGVIQGFNEIKRSGAAKLVYELQCHDFSAVFNHHLVAQVYENQTLQYIVQDIVTNFASDHGITTTNVQTGPTITKAIFNYTSAAEAFGELSELTGYVWWVDENKDLHFCARDTVAAPVSLTTTTALPGVVVSRTLSNYRNIQYVRAGNDVTSLQTENYKGDGARRVFNVAFPVALVPTVKVNTVTKTVGIRGIDSGKDWYWSKGTTEISQDAGGTLLTSSDTLQVLYQGLFPIIVRSDDSAAITERAGVEGTTGSYEALESASYIEKMDLALDKAAGLLRRYAIIPLTIAFKTRSTGLRAGQLLPVVLSDHGLNGSYLIDSINATYEPGIGFLYDGTALNGDGVGGWVEFFKKLAAAGKTFVIRENEVLVRLLPFTETMSFTDSITATSATYACAITGTAEVNYAETC